MTLTSPPFLPLSRPWAGLSVRWLVHQLLRIEDHQSSSPYLIFSVSSGACKKLTLRTSSCFPTIIPILSVLTRHDLFLLSVFPLPPFRQNPAPAGEYMEV